MHLDIRFSHDYICALTQIDILNHFFPSMPTGGCSSSRDALHEHKPNQINRELQRAGRAFDVKIPLDAFIF